MGDLPGEYGEVISYQNLYRCLNKLTEHKEGMFSLQDGSHYGALIPEVDILIERQGRAVFKIKT